MPDEDKGRPKGERETERQTKTLIETERKDANVCVSQRVGYPESRYYMIMMDDVT